MNLGSHDFNGNQECTFLFHAGQSFWKTVLNHITRALTETLRCLLSGECNTSMLMVSTVSSRFIDRVYSSVMRSLGPQNQNLLFNYFWKPIFFFFYRHAFMQCFYYFLLSLHLALCCYLGVTAQSDTFSHFFFRIMLLYLYLYLHYFLFVNCFKGAYKVYALWKLSFYHHSSKSVTVVVLFFFS